MTKRDPPDRPLSRRRFLEMAISLGASAAWVGAPSHTAQIYAPGRSQRAGVCERRDLFPEGVASGDPDSHSVLLWTRRPYSDGAKVALHVEVAEDPSFVRVVAKARAPVSAASDWTCRVLVGNLKPAHVYWYRFIDGDGFASRTGRTITAPLDSDPRTVRFAFVSCQNANLGEQHAYRRMIFEDERAREADRLGFVVHLGDFIYEVVWYPEDRPQGYCGRRVREIVRYPHGEKIGEWHVPVSVDDYRAIYRAYLHDQDLQDARARWPFVPIWDNHEFSIYGWQSMQIFKDQNRPAQTRKVAANQAWFEYQPARVVKSSGASLERFDPPTVRDAPIAAFDEHGLGQEPNNRAALASLTAYRALRWGKHVEIILTDQRSYRSEEPVGRPETKTLTSEQFPELIGQEVLEILDAGRAYANGHPPATIAFGGKQIPNFRKDNPPQTVLGEEQKRWFLNRLKISAATWKVWGNTLGTLDYRVDPQNLPAGLTQPWPGAGYAGISSGDSSTAYMERAEIYALLRDANVTGFATIAGDRHAFWAGLAAPALPPHPFEPVGIAFVTGSISAPGMVEKMEHSITDAHPLHALYMVRRSKDERPESTVNMLLRHGVRACLEYAKSGDLARARAISNPDLSPHLSFVDLGGNGFATVRASHDALECEFVCIPHPAEATSAPDGGPLAYRVIHRAPLWGPGEHPKLEQRVLEGTPTLSL